MLFTYQHLVVSTLVVHPDLPKVICLIDRLKVGKDRGLGYTAHLSIDESNYK